MFVTGGKEDLEQKKLEREWDALTVLVGVDKVSGAIFSTPCPKKGAVPYVVKALSDYLRRLRTENITIQTDNEDAILNLIAAFVESTPDLRIKTQRSPLGSSASNGAAERVVRTVAQHTLTSILDFTGRTGFAIGKKDRLLKWATRHATWIYKRFVVKTGSNMTPFQILSGVQYAGKMTQFGSTVLALGPTKDKRKKLDEKWH